MLDDSIMDIEDKDLILRSETALGHGIMDNVKYIVYVKPDKFDSSRNTDLVREIVEINPALGIPVKWPQIAGARLIAESALPGYRIEPSQGTHFFQNLTSFGVGYFTIDPDGGNGFIDMDYLDSLPAEQESDSIRIVRFPDSLTIAINGRKSKGIVRKP